jgi:hypothetical protein
MRAVLTLLTTLVSTGAIAQMDLQLMQKANGLAEIMAKSAACGYEIDQAKLDEYFAKSGLDNPETLSFISSSVQTAEFLGKPTPSDCTIARSTARSIGVLAVE